jgi:hypothetical protein
MSINMDSPLKKNSGDDTPKSGYEKTTTKQKTDIANVPGEVVKGIGNPGITTNVPVSGKSNN